jgi:hypothetical protein
MHREGLDGYYNCNGDKGALAARNAADKERLIKALEEMFGLENQGEGM